MSALQYNKSQNYDAAVVERIQQTVGATADGRWGAKTVAAVERWQRARGLAADGKVGPGTLARFEAEWAKAKAKPAGDEGPGFTAEGLERGARGEAVVDLQLRLAGFRGTTWDGQFGGGTALQVEVFQRDYMGVGEPTGVVDAATVEAINRFAAEHPLDFEPLRCRCGQCGGFGQGRFKGEYRRNRRGREAYHRYEYPGIHKAILNSYRALVFYAKRRDLPAPFFTCGYRCWIHNELKGRTSTNHMGKALDVDFPLAEGEDKRDDCRRCDEVRGLLVETGNFQIGWRARDRKALEPSRIAPSWIHMDVRCFGPRLLDDRFFVKSAAALDA